MTDKTTNDEIEFWKRAANLFLTKYQVWACVSCATRNCASTTLLYVAKNIGIGVGTCEMCLRSFQSINLYRLRKERRQFSSDVFRRLPEDNPKVSGYGSPLEFPAGLSPQDEVRLMLLRRGVSPEPFVQHCIKVGVFKESFWND